MRIGFIGTGFMGGAIAGHLQGAGHPLRVHDIDETAMRPFLDNGAKAGTSPRQIAETSDVVFSCLPGPPQVEQVALGDDGLIEGLHDGLIYVDLSTSTPQLIRRIGETFSAHGVGVLDAPVSGGVIAAVEGKLAVYVGGAKGTFERVKAVLHDIGRHVSYCGPLGAGEVVKLCNNMIGLSVIALLPDAFALGIKAGVDSKTLFESFAAGIADTRMMHLGFEPFLKGVEMPGTSPGVILKDLDLVISLSEEYGIPLTLCRSARERFAKAFEQGLGEQPAALMEQETGIALRDSWPKQ